MVVQECGRCGRAVTGSFAAIGSPTIQPGKRPGRLLLSCGHPERDAVTVTYERVAEGPANPA